MTARNQERSEGQQPHSVLKLAFLWTVWARRLTRYPYFARRSLNCLRVRRTEATAPETVKDQLPPTT